MLSAGAECWSVVQMVNAIEIACLFNQIFQCCRLGGDSYDFIVQCWVQVPSKSVDLGGFVNASV